MMRIQSWRCALLYVVLALLSLALVQAEAQTQPATGKVKVDRLVMGLITPYLDYIRPWINGTADHNIQHDPTFEWLVEVAPDGEYKPWLAESWRWPRTANHGASSYRKACNSTMAMASSPPKTLCTPTLCGVMRNILAAKTLPLLPTDQVSVRSTRSK